MLTRGLSPCAHFFSQILRGTDPIVYFIPEIHGESRGFLFGDRFI